MVISFSQSLARKQLLDKGEVYTYRWTRRSFFRREKGEVEYTWANSGRGTQKIANVEIREVGQMDGADSRDLEPYYEKSGFWSAEYWSLICVDFQGGIHARHKGYLYHVKKRSR